MDARVRDRLRWFQGRRVLATLPTRKKIATALGISRQAVDHHVNGKSGSISYEHLAKLARHPEANPYAVLSGAAAVIEEVRAQGTCMSTCTERLVHWLETEQQADGKEDVHQQRLVRVLGSLPFMSANLTLAFRQKATAELDAWEAEELAHVDAALAAIGFARRLRAMLAPVGEEGAA